MDFITSLSRTSRQHDSIMDVVDKWIKVAHFIVVKSTNSASEIAQIFIKKSEIAWCSQEDHIRQRCQVHFHVLEGVFATLGPYLVFSTTYYPHKDG